MDYKLISIEIEDLQNLRDFGGLDYDDGAEVVFDYMGLSSVDIRGIQKQGAGSRRMEIAVNDEKFLSSDVQRLIGENVRLNSGKRITISVSDSDVSDVYVKRVPMSWS